MREVPVPGLPGHPAQAGDPRGHGRRPVDRRGRGAVHRRRRRLAAHRRADRPRAADRRAGAQGDQRPARLPGRRRPGLPLARPRRGDAGRRRGAAHPAGHPDRLRAGRRALRAGRAVDRPAPARQPPAHRDAGPAAGPRQHADRRRARRGHHPHRRLGRRHRPARRRARRPHRACQRHGRGPAGVHRVDHRRLPVRAAPASTCRRSGARASAAASSSSRAPASTTCATSTSRSRSGCFVAVTGVSGSGQVDAGQRHPLHLAGQPDQRREAAARAAQAGPRHRAARQGRRRRPVADRAHAAVEPGHLHRRVRPHPQAVRRDHRGEDPRLPAGPVLLQRQGRALRDLLPATARSRSR